MRHALIVCLSAFAALAQAADLVPPDDASLPPQASALTIDENGFCGVLFGSDMATVVAALGKPNGIVELGNNRLGTLYGKACLLVFRANALREVFLTGDPGAILDYEVVAKMEDRAFFDNAAWSAFGLRPRMSFADVDALAGGALGTPAYRATWSKDRISLQLFFSSSENNGKREYSLIKVHITAR
jgi:hypothetical protein